MSINVSDVAQSVVRQAAEAGQMLGGAYIERVKNLYHGRAKDDLFSQLQLPAGHHDPYPIYRRMQEQGPVLTNRHGELVVTTYELCQQVLRNKSFGMIDMAAPPRPGEDKLELSLLALNPPDHTRLRRLAAPAFSPRRMEEYGILVATVASRLLDKAIAKGNTFDLMASFASPMPIAVITKMLGLKNDSERLRWVGSIVASALDGVQSLSHAAQLFVADKEMRATFAELIQRAETEPGDDLTSQLVAQRGESLSTDEIIALVGLLLLAGFETTVNAIGNGVTALLRNRTQWEKLVDDPSLASLVVEEVLRFEPPVQHTARVRLSGPDSVELGGGLVEPGRRVLVMLAAANRDPEVFADPDTFDFTRENASEHLAFASGIHYCLGSKPCPAGTDRGLQNAGHSAPKATASWRGGDAARIDVKGPAVTAGTSLTSFQITQYLGTQVR